MLYFSDVSDVLLQSIFKLNDDEKLSTSITISESFSKSLKYNMDLSN